MSEEIKKDEVVTNKEDDTTIKRNDKSKGLIIVIVILSILLIGLCIYIAMSGKMGSKATTQTSEKVNKTKIIEAYNNLKKNDTFIITTYMNAPMGDTSYIEYVCPEYSATLVDDEHIEEPYQQLDLTDVNFRFNDIITKDNKMYLFYEGEDEEGNATLDAYEVPSEYAKECTSRRYMYFEYMKDDLRDIKFSETTETDLGNGEVKMDVYSAKLPSSVVKRILGNGNISLYKSVQENTLNEGMKKMMGWLIDDIDFTMVFSDANVLIGIVDDTLAYVNLEIGGLGTKEYLSKCYIKNVDAVKNIEVPNTSNAIKYEDLYADYADMALEYDSMEDLYNAIYNDNDEVLSEEELQELLHESIEGKTESGNAIIETKPDTDNVITDSTSSNTITLSDNNTEKVEENE